MRDSEYLKKKLLYQSKNRGCKETDILLGKFADEFLEKMSDPELELYADLLQENDADIVDWVTKNSPLPDRVSNEITKKLVSYYKY